MIKLIAQTIVD